MKNLFSKTLAFALILCVTNIFANPITTANYTTPESSVNQFLSKYYVESYNFGKTVETIVENQTIIVSEVLNADKKTVKGYVAINKINNELLYFVDYNRTSKMIKAIDFKNNTTDLINLQKENKFENFIKIDLIKEIEKVNLDPSSTMKFWGTSCGASFSLEAGSCYKNCCYYVLWANTGCEVETC